jgi:CubicO group peptidase (beta-lactamase class C family)
MINADIDALVEGQIDSRGPGVAVAVVKDGALLHCQGYGFANVEWEQAIAPDTVFSLASLTKPFTAQAILLLEREEKLHLDAPITTYLPDYPTRSQDITLAHLLTHTSGIKDYFAVEGAFDEGRSTIDWSPDSLIALFKELPLDFEPGTQRRYSNSGYYLLGKIIETVSGMSFEAFVRTAIFQPVGMDHSYYMSNQSIIPHRATGYLKTEQGYQHAAYLSGSITYAAGALGSTLEDLIRWDTALREQRLLDHTTQERQYTPVGLANGRRENYGFGWGIGNYRNHRVVDHLGLLPGVSTFIGRFLDDPLTMIILSNMEGFDTIGLAQQISAAVADLPPVARKPITLDADALGKVTGTYFDAFSGATIEVRSVGQMLKMDGPPIFVPITCQLMPLSETTYYSTENEDMEVHFEEALASGFHCMTILTPFISITATKVFDDNSDG